MANAERQSWSVLHTPTPMAPTLESSPSPFMSTSGSVVFPGLSTTPCSRPRTRKIARIAARDVTGPELAAPTWFQSSHSGFASMEGPPPIDGQGSPLALTPEFPDIRSLSYYQHLPVKLEDLLSDSESSTHEEEEEEGGKQKQPLEVNEGDAEIKDIQVADRFYRGLLLRRAMKVLVRNVLVGREVAKMAVWHHQQWKLQLLFHKWRKMATVLRKKRLQVTFSTWRTRAALCSRLNVATERRNEELLAYCFSLWQSKTTAATCMKKKALQYFRAHLKWKAFRRWRTVAVKSRQRMQSSAAAFHRTKTLEKAFFTWRAMVLCRLEDRQRGTHLLQRAQLRGIFNSWRRVLSYKKRQRQLGQCLKSVRDRRTLQRSLVVWRQELHRREKVELARKTLVLRQKRRVFQAWREYIYRCTLKKLCDVYLYQSNVARLQEVFNRWVCQTAALVGESLLSSRLSMAQRSLALRVAFAGWREVARVTKGVRGIRGTQERRLLVQSFQMWRRMLERVQSLGAQCVVLEGWRTRRLFRMWRAHLLHRWQEKTAVLYHNSHTLQTAFAFWKAEHWRQCLSRAFVASHQNDQLKVAFNKWKATKCIRREKSRIKIADQFCCQRLMKKCLLAWQVHAKVSAEELDELARTVVRRLEELKVCQLFKFWKRQLHCHQAARLCIAQKNQKLFVQCFSSWRELTLEADMQASLLFMVKLQSILSSCASQCNSSESLISLATASYNLGLDPSRYGSLDSTPSCASDVRMLRCLSRQIQRSLESSKTRLGTFPPPYSTPTLSSSGRDRADAAPLRLEDLDSSSEWMPARRQLFTNGTEDITHRQRSMTPPHSQGQYASQVKVEVNSSYQPSATCPPQQTVPSSPTGQDPTLSQECVGESFDQPVNLESDHTLLEPPHHFSPQPLQLQYRSVSGDLALPPHTPGSRRQLYLDLSSSPPIDLALSDLPIPHPLQRLCHSVRYIKLFPCSKAFSTWRWYARKRKAVQELGQLLEGRRRTRETRRAFSIWKELGMKRAHLREVEADFVRKAEDHALRATFRIWKKAARQRMSDKEAAGLKAVEFSEKSCLRRHWLQWRDVCEARMGENSKHQLVETIILKSAFTCWKRRARLRGRTRQLLIRWKHAAKGKREDRQAKALATYWTLSQAWRRWRVGYIKEVAAARVERKTNRELLQLVFSSWMNAVLI